VGGLVAIATGDRTERRVALADGLLGRLLE
jgi:hypothetical protein